MSLHLDIVLRQFLYVEDLVKSINIALRDLLNVTDITPVEVHVIKQGIVTNELPLKLTKDCGSLLISLDGKYPITLSVFETMADDNFIKEVTVAYVTDTGLPAQKSVMAVACAIAVAREAQGMVEDNGLMWGDVSEREPEDFLKSLQCQSPHLDIEEAFLEVLGNIQKYRK